MATDSWERVRALFYAALDRAPGERLEFLSRECADPVLRGDVQSLLEAHETKGGAVEDLRGGALPHAVQDVLGHGLALVVQEQPARGSGSQGRDGHTRPDPSGPDYPDRTAFHACLSSQAEATRQRHRPTSTNERSLV